MITKLLISPAHRTTGADLPKEMGSLVSAHRSRHKLHGHHLIVMCCPNYISYKHRDFTAILKDKIDISIVLSSQQWCQSIIADDVG